jgi:hypothetical protein
VATPRSWEGEDGGLEGLREMLVVRRGDGFHCLLDDGIKADATERKQQKRPCTAPQPFLKVTSASSRQKSLFFLSRLDLLGIGSNIHQH